jgi:hypothetical protein
VIVYLLALGAALWLICLGWSLYHNWGSPSVIAAGSRSSPGRLFNSMQKIFAHELISDFALRSDPPTTPRRTALASWRGRLRRSIPDGCA